MWFLYKGYRLPGFNLDSCGFPKNRLRNVATKGFKRRIDDLDMETMSNGPQNMYNLPVFLMK